MKPAVLASSILAALAIVGCAVHQLPATAAIQFNYRTENAASAGVVQVFDLNGSTVVQVRNIEIRKPVFLDDENVEIKHQVVGQTAVLSGIHRSFTVARGSARTRVFRNDAVASRATTPVADQDLARVSTKPATGPDASEEQMWVELARLKTEIATLRAFLASDGAKTDDQAVGLETVAQAEMRYAPIASSRRASEFLIRFRNNSDELTLKPAEAVTLLELSKKATGIAVTGYTDSAIPNAGSVRLAKARAVAAAKYLISNGVEKSKISMSFKPAGGFIADNSTKEGRDKNRRVEIEIM